MNQVEYEVTIGYDKPILVERAGIQSISEHRSRVFGMRQIGVYGVGMVTYHGLPVLSFLYNKQQRDGNLETFERVIIQTGFGRGVHPDHVGQEPATYVIGADVARLDPKVDTVIDWVLPERGAIVTPKHFSLDCIVGGMRGDKPVLANS